MFLFIAGLSGHGEWPLAGKRVGANHLLFSYADFGQRQAATLQLFVAGLGNGDDNWAMARKGGAVDILCSYGHDTSKMTAAHFAPRDREADLKTFLAGIPGDSVLNRERLDKSPNRSILASFAAPESRSSADHIVEREKMKLFVAGNWGPELQREVCESTGERNILFTNAHAGAQDCADAFATNPELQFSEVGYHLLIDSGAFTAWRMGKPIVLADYIQYAKELREKAHEGTVIEFIGLDVIAGKFGGPKPTPAEFEAACQQGYDNWKEMEKAGVPCIPTFHRGDEMKWLDKIAREIKIGGRLCLAPKVDGSRVDVKTIWLDDCFRMLEGINKDLNFQQKINLEIWDRWRIHGLGISSQELMQAYPFYSVDSTGWLWAAQNCTYRWFKDGGIACRQKDEYMDTVNWNTANDPINVECRQHYRPSKNHKFIPYDEPMFDILGEAPTCQACGEVEEGHDEKQEQCSLDVGAYWFGQKAIQADVDLAKHVTALWQRRGVRFDGEEQLAAFDPKERQDWRRYDSGHKDQPGQQTIEESTS